MQNYEDRAGFQFAMDKDNKIEILKTKRKDK